MPFKENRKRYVNGLAVVSWYRDSYLSCQLDILDQFDAIMLSRDIVCLLNTSNITLLCTW